MSALALSNSVKHLPEKLITQPHPSISIPRHHSRPLKLEPRDFLRLELLAAGFLKAGELILTYSQLLVRRHSSAVYFLLGIKKQR